MEENILVGLIKKDLLDYISLRMTSFADWSVEDTIESRHPFGVAKALINEEHFLICKRSMAVLEKLYKIINEVDI